MTDVELATVLEPIFMRVGWNPNALRVDFWDGSTFGNVDAKATIRFKSPEALRYILYAPGELGIARAYISGNIELEGDSYEALAHLTQIDPDWKKLGGRSLTRALSALKSHGVFGARLPVPAEENNPKGKRHSKERDATAISHHYDVGNEFYRNVLGETMTYSCARYTEEEQSLDEAQYNKYDMVCRKLDLQPGQRLLDVGCGWGGMVLHAAQYYGVSAVGITLSAEQARLARERVEKAGLSDQIEIRIQDYRDLRNEEFDGISSIGMFEHVGKTKMREYFTTLHAALAPQGRLLHHAIDKPDGSVMSSRGFIARYVFPDGELQDIATTLEAMQEAGFEVRDVESLREHYARTLRGWVNNLERNWDRCVELSSEGRVRVWWLYMIGSSISFETNRISIHQTIGVKTDASGASGMPLTRRPFV